VIELAALLDEAALDRELVRRNGLRKFIELAWHVVEAAAFISSWHIDAIADHLSAVSRGEIERLVINVPPGCSKSLITSVLWPSWQWIPEPEHKFMAATFDAALARRDALRMRSLIKSDWFQRRWPSTQINDGDDVQQTMGVFHTTAGGFRFSTTVGGGATGWHCHTQILDDPHKPEDLNVEPETARASLERNWEWWRGTMASRKADPSKFRRVVIMQRLHEEDLAGRCIEEGYTHLMLPMRFECRRACVTIWGGDRRTAEGELLCPERFDEASVAKTEQDMGTRVKDAQNQQRPAPAEGNIFQRSWLAHEWTELPRAALMVQSWDCSFKDSATADFVAGQLWAVHGGKFYLVDRVHRRMGLPETVAAIRAWAEKYPTALAKLIEDKANGPAVEQVLRNEMPGIIMLEPKMLGGSKVGRANAVAPLFEAGSVLVPMSARAAWIEEWREEMASFPFARNDDDVDATTQALVYLSRGHVSHDGDVLSGQRRSDDVDDNDEDSEDWS
jgi:predicted phage terminase large subunit-like protein